MEIQVEVTTADVVARVGSWVRLVKASSTPAPFVQTQEEDKEVRKARAASVEARRKAVQPRPLVSATKARRWREAKRRGVPRPEPPHVTRDWVHLAGYKAEATRMAAAVVAVP